jgi:hypothetical protein
MTSFFENRDHFSALEQTLPPPWHAVELDDDTRSGVTFRFPVPAGARRELLVPPVAKHFYGNSPDGPANIGIVRRKLDDDSEFQQYLEVDLDWPISTAINLKLLAAAELVVDACINEGLLK